MTTIADPWPLVTGGVDTHAEVHVARVAGQAGRVVGTEEFPAKPGGPQGSTQLDAATTWG